MFKNGWKERQCFTEYSSDFNSLRKLPIFVYNHDKALTEPLWLIDCCVSWREVSKKDISWDVAINKPGNPS